MTDLDRSLSDIVRDNNRGRGRGRGRGNNRGAPGGFYRGNTRGGAGGRGGGGGAPRGNFRGTGRGGRPFVGAGNNVANGTGPIRKDRTFSRPQTAPYPPATPSPGSGLAAGAKILLSNLDSQIAEEDLQEIFQNVGPVTRTVIHYARDGTSLGSGEVHFANKNDALRAADEYDAAQVDGRPMSVKVIANKVPTVVQRLPPGPPLSAMPPLPLFSMPAFPLPLNFGQRDRSFNRPRGGGWRGPPRGRGSGSGRGRGRGGRGAGRTPSVAELDTDMDNYFASSEGDLAAAGQPANPSAKKK